MIKKISVKSGEIAVVNEPCLLEAIGLGSCVAVCLYDRVHKIAGIAHIMLGHPPDEKRIEVNPLRYADYAIDGLIKGMERIGSMRHYMNAKIFGGAAMFSNSMFNIGGENIKAVKDKLDMEGIRIIAEEVGGEHGRSIWFNTEDGKVVVGSVFGPTKEY